MNWILEKMYRLLLEMRRARIARWLCSPQFDRVIHPRGWEPEVIRCLCDTPWNGPVWDVGAALGKLAFEVAKHHRVIAFEPNFNMLYYLASNLKDFDNVLIVPCALTIDGKPLRGSFDPDFHAAPTGPLAATISIEEAVAKVGKPGVIKIDIEGGEYELIKSSQLSEFPLLIEWHGPIPKNLPYWDIKDIDDTHSLLTPKK